MSKICQISGKKVQFGNNVSKSINKTKRRFNANIVTINKKGISAVLKEAK